jgi:hypothetical protein
MRHVAIGTVAVLAIAATSHADFWRTHDTSAAAIIAPHGGYHNPFAASVLYSTGFEQSEGFNAGPINTQNGWTNFTANDNIPAISTANPHTGAQHLRNSKGPGANSSLNGAFSPNFGPQDPGSYNVNVWFASNDLGGADHMLIAQAPSQGFLTWRLHFQWQGQIQVLDDLGSGLQFVNTGATWTADGVYREVLVKTDYDTNTIDYYYDGVHIYSSAAGVFAGTSVEQVILASDNWYIQGGWGDWDNLMIYQKVPAPGALALLGLAGLVGVRRRRA